MISRALVTYDTGSLVHWLTYTVYHAESVPQKNKNYFAYKQS